MNVKTAWNRFWFADAPYFDLALLRIIAVGFHVFFLLAYQFEVLPYSLSLPASQYEPLYLLKAFVWPWGFATPPGAQIVYGLFWATVLFGFSALIGFLTNITMFCFAIGSLLLTAFIFSFGDYHHPEAVLLIGLLVISLGPCGRVMSVDNLLRRHRGTRLIRVPLLEAKSPYAGWPIKLIQCLYPLMYLSAAVAKLAYNRYTLDWANGYTLQYYFIQDHIRKGIPLAMWASQFHYFIWFGQIVVLTFQLTYFLVVPFARLRWIYLPLGAMFHIGNYLILKAPFPQWVALLAVYIPWAVAFQRLASKQVTLDAPASSSMDRPTLQQHG